MKQFFFIMAAPQALATGWRGRLRLQKLEEQATPIDWGENRESNGLSLQIWGTVQADSTFGALRKLVQYRRHFPAFYNIYE